MRKTTLPSGISRLFWDTDPEGVDLETHKDYVLERVMSRGDWEAMRWLRAAFAPAVIRDFLERKGSRLAPRELAYWALLVDLSVSARPGGGRPDWAG